MLEQEMKEQLKSVYSTLESEITLLVKESTHDQQQELLEMLEEVASTSEKISVKKSKESSPNPAFEILKNQAPTGIHFRGIPGGHEFTSLILAILNSDHKGRIPDEGILSRIQSLKGPLSLKTYISLSCENCPEVVQALNLMAIFHPEFQHEMIDGAFASDEIETLGIQGVPSIVSDGKMIHSGKISFSDLLEKLEETFGKNKENLKPVDLGEFDVVVIGGGPAGASSAIYSVRKGLKTALIAEKLGGQLQETKGIENMISLSYTEGVRLAADIQKHLSSYPVKILEHRRVNHIEQGEIKSITLNSGETLKTKAIIVATGAKWRELGIPGEKEHIGMGVAFCAHCDGPFYKGKKVVVVGGGNSGVEAAIDLSAITTHVTLLEFGEKLKADDVLVDKAKKIENIEIITQAKSTKVVGDGKKVSALEYEDRKSGKIESISTDGVFVQIGLLPNSQFIKDMVETTPYGEIVVDAKGRTSQEGIYAAGDVTTVPFKQIIIAMGDGAKVALTAFEDRLRKKAG